MKQFLMILAFLTINIAVFSQSNPVAPTVSTWNGISGINGKYINGTDIPSTVFDPAVGGTASSPYLINNATEFAYLAYKVNHKENATSYSGKYFKLTTNIDLNGNSWTPIGSSPSSAHSFSGSFDGGGKTVSNLNIDTPKSDNVGLFGIIDAKNSTVVIENLNIDGGTVKGRNNVGGIIGGILTGPVTITKCDNLGVKVVGTGTYVGGIVGTCDGYIYAIAISQCSNFASIEGYSAVGGITGTVANAHVSVTHCINYYNIIKAVRGKSGGIAGENKGTIRGCFNNGQIIGGGTWLGYGGIVGMNYNLVETCFNMGSITGVGDVGGIVGTNVSDPKTGSKPAIPTVRTCYNSGNVMSTNGAVGGIVGRNALENSAGGVVLDVYNIGVVGSTNIAALKGVVVGSNENTNQGALTNCYYDSQFNHTATAVGGKADNDATHVNVMGKLTKNLSGAAETPPSEVGSLFSDNTNWEFGANSYPRLKQLHSSGSAGMTRDIGVYSNLSTAVVYLYGDAMRWNNVSSSFFVSNVNGIKWRSDDRSIVNISGVVASITPKGGKVNLIASLNNVERQVSIIVMPSTEHVYSNQVFVNPGGRVFARGSDVPNGGVVEIRRNDMEMFQLIPNDGYYLSALTFTTIANSDKTETIYDALNAKKPDGSLNLFTPNFDNAALYYLISANNEAFKYTKLTVTFSPVEPWDGNWNNSNKPFLATDGESRYLVYRPSELAWLVQHNTEVKETKLVNHLNMGGLEWQFIPPHGESIVKYEYNGKFYGNRKTIYNFKKDVTNGNNGCFDILGSDAVVSELGVIGATFITSLANGETEVSCNTGAIAGINKGLISQCYSIANIECKNENSNAVTTINTGGLVGLNYGTVEYSYFSGNATVTGNGLGTIHCGGVVGFDDVAANSKQLFYDNQMCVIPLVGDETTGRAIGNEPNSASCFGLATLNATLGTENAVFTAFNTLGSWLLQSGRYPVLDGSENVDVVKVGATTALFVKGENVENIKSNFPLGAEKTSSNKNIQWVSSNPNIISIVNPTGDLKTAMAVVKRGEEDANVTLTASYFYTPVGATEEQEVSCKDITLKVIQKGVPVSVWFKINGVAADGDKITSSAVDRTTEALNPENTYGAEIIFDSGSAATISIIPGPQRYLTSLTQQSKIGEQEIGEPVEMLQDVSILYEDGRLAYRIYNLPENTTYYLVAKFADIPIWDGTYTTLMEPHKSESGMQHLIYHPAELAWLSNETNKQGTPSNFSGQSFKLINNIDLGGTHQWNPIGNRPTVESEVVNSFKGEMNGNRKTIKNLTINKPNEDYVGLFGYLDSGARILNLIMEDCKITGQLYVGAIAGYTAEGRDDLSDFNLDGCTIQNSTAIGVNNLAFFVKGTNNVGGIVGHHSNKGIIRNCTNLGVIVEGRGNVGGIVGYSNGICYTSSNKGNINGANNVGGIVGYNIDKDGVSHINKCSNSGVITATGSRGGGIIGYNSSPLFATVISNNVNSGAVSGTNLLGGIVGENNSGELSQNYNLGDITGSLTASDGIGGIVGFNINNSVDLCFNSGVVIGFKSIGGIVGMGSGSIEMGVSNCYNVGIIKGESYVGGIVGGAFGFIKNCYNVGGIRGKVGNEISIGCGAIAGYPNPDGVENCFYDKQMIAMKAVNNVDVAGAKGWLTTEIVNDGKGFTNKVSWSYTDGLYPQLIVFDTIVKFKTALLAPIFLKVTTPADFETVSWLRNDFTIGGSDITWTSDKPGIIEIDTTSKNGTVTHPAADDVVTCTGSSVYLDGFPLRKIMFVAIQDDKYRKVFKGVGDWSDRDHWWRDGVNTDVPNGIDQTNNAIIDVDAHATIKDGVNAISGQTQVKGKITIEAGGTLKVQRMGNFISEKVILFNEKEKHASFIVLDQTGIKPSMTINQNVSTGYTMGTDGNPTSSKYQLLSIPIPTLSEGQEVINVFDGAWLDRYNQQAAMWERYENEYYGKKYFDVERGRGYSVSYSSPDTTIVFKGQMFAESAVYTIKYDKKEIGGTNYGGLNLIGNPYASSMKIDWAKVTNVKDANKAITAADMEFNVWVWDSKNGNYKTYPGTTSEVFKDGIIPSCQGFWVKVKPMIIDKVEYSNDIGISIPYEPVEVNTEPLYKSNNEVSLPFIKLGVKGSRYSDEVTVLEVDDCTLGYDNGWDGEKWAGYADAPQFYAVEGELKLAVNAKSDVSETLLCFEAGEDSQYVIESLGAANVEGVQLVDLKMGTTHDIISHPYSFTATKEDVKNRFILKAKSTFGVENIETQDWCNIFSYQKTITIVNGEGEVEVIDMQGRVIKSMKISSDRCSFTIDKTGTYVVRVIGEKGIVSQKLVID